MILQRYIIAALLTGGVVFAQLSCTKSPNDSLSEAERNSIADSLKTMVTNTYDFAKPGVVDRMMGLYPQSGPVYSTSTGRVTTTREELRTQIGTFWQYVGSNMRNPKWQWTSMHVDVLAPNAAVMTASYRIPHITPRNTPHVIAGAWTAAFAKRGGRWVIIHEHLSDAPASPADHPEH